MTKLGQLIDSFIAFINNVLVPLVFALALIVFLFGVFRYFIAGGADPKKQSEGKQLIIYSILGFAVMVSVWGLVNLVTGTFMFDNVNRPAIPTFGNTTSNSSNCTNISNCAGSNINTNGTPQNPSTSGFGNSPTSSKEPINPSTGLPGIY